MAEQSRDNERAVNTKRPKKRWRLIVIIIIIVLFCSFIWIVRQYQSVDEKLAAIEAARAIPVSENAAIIYNQLLDKYDKSVFSSLPIDSNDTAIMRPWLSKDFPELAKCYEEKKEITAKLLQINKYERCRFSILKFWEDFPTTMDRLSTMRVMVFYLIRLANNDIAENRIEQGLEKYLCAIRICRHSRQQPFTIFFSHGITFESLALTRMRYCILHSNLTEEHLQTIEKALTQSDEEQTQNWEDMIAVENLYAKQTPLINRLEIWLQNLRNHRSNIDFAYEFRTRLLADRHGNQILILLRNYKDKTGHWPQNLDELQPLADKEILIDPQNNYPFIYKTTEDDFILYGRGPNKIDEGGRFHSNGSDDWLIWPRKIPPKKDLDSKVDMSNQEQIK